MSVRKDEVQILVEVNGENAGKTLKQMKTEAAALKKEARLLNKELDGLTPNTAEFIAKAKEIADVDKKYQGLRKTINQVRDATRGISREMTKMQTESKGVTGFFKSFLPALGPAAIIAGAVGIGRAIFGIASESLKLFNVQAKADAQLKSTLKSTNEAAGRTFDQLKEQASALQGVTLFGDETTQQAQALLLTFTQIKEEVFDDSIPLIQDYATAMATASGETVDLKSASIQVGKALNDPIKGISALSKSGVSFSESQKEMIRNLQETGDVAGAQRIILKELESQFGGSARAAAEAGTGGYTQFTNKLGDIQESIGALVSGGVSKFLPFLNKGADFMQKFVDTVISGESATGKFSKGINFLVGTLKASTVPFRVLYNIGLVLYSEVFIPLADFIDRRVIPAFKSSSDSISSIVETAKKIPFIGNVIRLVMVSFKVFGDLMDDVGASFSGFAAAANQAVENVKTYFNDLALSAEIVAQKLNLALSIRQETKDRIQADIQRLENLKDVAANSGKTIGEAYAEARNKVIEDARKVQAEEEQVQAEKDAVKFAKTQAVVEKQAAEEKKDRLALRLQELKNHYEREQLILESQYLKGEILEKEYHQALHDETLNFYEKQIDAYSEYGQAASNEALKVQNQLLEGQQISRRNSDVPDLLPGSNISPVESNGEDSEAKIAGDEESQLFALQERFAAQIIAEEEYEYQRLEVQRNAAERRLELLQASGESNTNEVRAAQTEIFDIEREMSEQRIATAQKEKELKKTIERAKTQLAQSALDAAIELLSRDEKARKKNAAAIKAFQIGKILVNLPTEISGYWQQYGSIPVVGPVIAGLFSALAGVRAYSAVRQINTQKFYRGGAVRAYSGEKIRGAANAPTQLGGDNIMAYLKAGEVVLNPEQQDALGGAPTFAKIGVPGFAGGGIVESRLTTVDTTPRGNFVSDLATAPSSTGDAQAMMVAVDRMTAAVEAMPKRLRADVVYEDVLAKDSEMKESEAKASL